MIYNYKRISTPDQCFERQLPDVPCDREFLEVFTGSIKQRPQLSELLKVIENGDTVNVHSIDRFGRNMNDLLELVQTINNMGATVCFKTQGMTFSPTGGCNPKDNLMFQVLCSFAEFERSMIVERIREGVERAKLRKAYTGGKKKIRTPEKMAELIAALNDPKKTRLDVCFEFHITPPTLFSYMKLHKDKIINRRKNSK